MMRVVYLKLLALLALFVRGFDELSQLADQTHVIVLLRVKVNSFDGRSLAYHLDFTLDLFLGLIGDHVVLDLVSLWIFLLFLLIMLRNYTSSRESDFFENQKVSLHVLLM